MATDAVISRHILTITGIFAALLARYGNINGRYPLIRSFWPSILVILPLCVFYCLLKRLLAHYYTALLSALFSFMGFSPRSLMTVLAVSASAVLYPADLQHPQISFCGVFAISPYRCSALSYNL